jgi:hypothetical protein
MQKVNAAYEMASKRLTEFSSWNQWNSDSDSDSDYETERRRKKARTDAEAANRQREERERQQREQERQRKEREEQARQQAELEKRRAADNRARLTRMVEQEWPTPLVDMDMTEAQAESHVDAAKRVTQRLMTRYTRLSDVLKSGKMLTDDDFEILLQHEVADRKYHFYNSLLADIRTRRYDKYRRYCASKMDPLYQLLWAIWVVYKERKLEVKTLKVDQDSRWRAWHGQGVSLTKHEIDAYLDLLTTDISRWTTKNSVCVKKCRQNGWLIISKTSEWVLTQTGIMEAHRLWA